MTQFLVRMIEPGPAGRFENTMRRNGFEIEEIGTEKYRSLEAAQEATSPGQQPMQPLAEELCRLIAQILARALEASDEQILTSGERCIESGVGE